MIPLDGKVLLGLDEFMLRYGHLRMICFLASKSKSTLLKLEKKASEKLTKFVDIPEKLEEDVAFYLKTKHLCSVEGKSMKAEKKNSFRYPSLILKEHKKGSFKICSLKPNERPTVWWQDLCLSSPEVVSGLGSVTADLKKHSGLSHLIELSKILGLLEKSGKLSQHGQLIAKLNDPIDFESNTINPYILKENIFIFGFLFLSSDLDVFSRLVPKILTQKNGIKKKEAQAIFRSTVEDIVKEAKTSKTLGTKKKSSIIKLYKDLKVTSRTKDIKVEESSTAWHRTSSRFEAYTDLGFLDKPKTKRLSFTYYPTDKLRNAANLLSKDYKNSRDWFEDNITEIIFGRQEAEANISADDLKELLPDLLSVLNRPTESFSIDIISLGIVFLMSRKGRLLKISAVRKCIESFARDFPEAARLMRGRIGNRAEYVYFNMRKI